MGGDGGGLVVLLVSDNVHLIRFKFIRSVQVLSEWSGDSN